MAYNLDQIKAGLQRRPPDLRVLTPGQKGVIINILEKVCGSKKGRKMVMAWCFPAIFGGRAWEQVSSKELNDAHWDGLFRWIDYRKLMTGEYAYHAGLEEECAKILYEQAQAMGEMRVAEVEAEHGQN